jgi:hypothetical protein
MMRGGWSDPQLHSSIGLLPDAVNVACPMLTCDFGGVLVNQMGSDRLRVVLERAERAPER